MAQLQHKEYELLSIAETRPLVVDLDGTLIRSDLLLESAFALLKRNILFAAMLPIWLLRGKARLKHEIASRVDLDPALLPYQEEFLDYLKREHADGRRLVLATASNIKFAKAVAGHLGIFSEVLASDETTNLSGSRKLERVQEEYVVEGFDYAGNAMVDLELWDASAEVIVVNPERGVAKRAERKFAVSRLFDDREGHAFTRYLTAMRVHQWLKNLLVFVPLVLAHEVANLQLAGQALLAFIAYGLCASSVYLLNDLFDLPDDRKHPTKRQRPFASGAISLTGGACLIPVLLGSAFLVAALLPTEFIAVLATYYVATLAYSLRLKRSPLVDVLTLAGLYTLRIIAGATAVSVVPSFWLLSFSMCLFLSLALVKRYTELLTLQQLERKRTSGRGYLTADLETLSQFGSASAYLAVLVLALYINSDAVLDLYTHPELIWLLCPLLLYVVMRIWLLARRNKLADDPVVFIASDRRSQWLAIVAAGLLWLAI